MDKDTMIFLDNELAHAGEETQLSPQMLLLEKLRITTEKELPKMEFLFRLFGKPCFPRRELVAITGKAKSGKTLVTSMLMACCLVEKVLDLERNGQAGRLRVLWFDTEQSDESTQDILRNRVERMVGESSGLEPSFDVFNVRAVAWKDRRGLLKEAVARCKPDLVVVDGIRDLVNDINDGVLAQEVMEELMHMATAGNCCIVCVLHQNKSGEDHNLRGWIGTELMNKAFEVYSCEKLLPQCVFKLEQTLTRKYDITQSMFFEMDADGLPRQCAVPAAEGAAPGAAPKEPLPQLNREYIVHEDGNPKGWQFDVVRLFLDAMHGEEEVAGGELRQRVMKLSGIAIPFKYNALLEQALSQKVIVKSMRDGRTIYQPAPF